MIGVAKSDTYVITKGFYDPDCHVTFVYARPWMFSGFDNDAYPVDPSSVSKTMTIPLASNE